MRNSVRQLTRRDLLGAGAALAAGAVLLKADSVLAQHATSAPAKELEVTVTEDLMREHGVLARLELLYEAVARQLQDKPGPPPPALANALEIEDRFIHGYHEKDEEQFIFPVFEKAGKQVELVKTLRAQHDAGRAVNKRLRDMARDKAADAKLMREDLLAIGRMYRPHAAREDTVVFVQFKTLVSASQYDDIGDKMEDKERELFGADGFEKIVAQLADLEKSLGILELPQFTARVA